MTLSSSMFLPRKMIFDFKTDTVMYVLLILDDSNLNFAISVLSRFGSSRMNNASLRGLAHDSSRSRKGVT